jgi:hypothetical protein
MQQTRTNVDNRLCKRRVVLIESKTGKIAESAEVLRLLTSMETVKNPLGTFIFFVPPEGNQSVAFGLARCRGALNSVEQVLTSLSTTWDNLHR